MNHIGCDDQEWSWGGTPENAIEELSSEYEKDIQEFKQWIQEQINFFQDNILNREASYEVDQAKKDILEEVLKKHNEIF